MQGVSQFVGIAGLLLSISLAGTARAEDVKSLDPNGAEGVAALMSGQGQGELADFLSSRGWVNQSGSVMNFTLSSSGQITGSYVNNAAGTGCQGTAYPLVGYLIGDTIAWSVLWNNSTANCNSVTAWGGYYDPGTSSIITDWTLAYEGSQGGAIENGSDTFTYQ